MKLKIVALSINKTSLPDKIINNICGESIEQILIFDKDYNIVNPALPISSPFYNWDMLATFAKLIVNANEQNRLIVIDTSNSILSVQQDIITDLFSFIKGNYTSILKDAFNRFLIYAGPSLSVVDIDTGKLVVSDSYGVDEYLPQETVSLIKKTVDETFTKEDQPESESLAGFRSFIHSHSKNNMNLPFKKSGKGYIWDIPFNVNGVMDYPFSFHLRTDPENTQKMLQITLKQLSDKKRNNNFINPQMPEGLRAWLTKKTQNQLKKEIQITEGGKSSINFNAYGFNTKLGAINDINSKLNLDSNAKKIIYIGDEAKIFPNNHLGNDSIVYSVPNISLINTGNLFDGSRSLDEVDLSLYNLKKGNGAKLFNVNVSNVLKQKSSLQTTLETIKSWFL